MSYKKYVELLDINDITGEPTEFVDIYPSFYPTFSQTISQTISPTIFNTGQNNNNNNTNLILIVFFSSVSGLVFILIILWIKYKERKKKGLGGNFSRNITVGKLYDEEFGTQYILDDI